MLIGVLGGGQLGRMMALAGYPLGLRFRFLDPSPEAPAGQVGELVVGSFEVEQDLERFARGVDMVTYEFENVPASAAAWLAARVPVYPPPGALDAAQDRVREKSLFERVGIPTPAFAPVASESELREAVERIGVPAVLKTRRGGYDGKGQFVLRAAGDAAEAWRSLGAAAHGLVLESFVPFEREVSVLAVRGRGGEAAFYPLVQNEHAGGILRRSIAPAPRSGSLRAEAESYVGRLMDELGYVGVLTVEFFVQGGRLLANEMAPRVHNSGHWTIEGAATSQFENHVRAIAGWPLGSTEAVGCSAMINLIGCAPEPSPLLAMPGVRFHWYGKEPRPGRKVGHITVRGGDEATLMARVAAVEEALARPRS